MRFVRWTQIAKPQSSRSSTCSCAHHRHQRWLEANAKILKSSAIGPPPVRHETLDELTADSAGSSADGLLTADFVPYKKNRRTPFQRVLECLRNEDFVLPSAYPDHPERDSLDGNLPGSSHGTGNPPPPPAPPQPGLASRESAKLSDLKGSPAGQINQGFSKGPPPNTKHKKPKKMKGEVDENSGGDDEMRDNLGPLEKKSHASRKLREYPSMVPPMRDRDYDGPGGYRSWKEPYMYLWTVMSGMYGKLVVLLMFAFCLTEVLENDVAPLTFQGIFLIYLYVGSIFAIICIYTSVIMENCPSMSASKENLTKQGDPEVGSITSFGTLKRAHISRSKTSRTSFYLRIGALVFGLVTLIFNGLEIAMHSTMREDCAQDVMFAHPIMQALFTFLQMHFLFVNSEVVVEKFGQIARFAFMHLVATNLAIWVRMVVWESANDWIQLNYSEMNVYEIPWHAQKVLHLHTCYHNNTLGRLWTGSQQQFFPFLIEYSLIAAAVTYIMWRNVGKERIRSLSNLSKTILEETLHEKRGRKGHWKVDCRSASKGLFLGLLVLVGGIVILIIFFVMKDHDGFDEKMFWMVNGTQIIILTLSILSCLIGFWQVPKLAVSATKPLELDRLLLSCTIVGVYIFAIFGMILGGLYFDEQKLMATFCSCCLLIVQVSLQGMLVAEASRRTCATRLQQLVKPGRQVITFLLFSNITLWILDSFITHSSLSQQFQIGFYGTLAWGIISRISLPLMILYRFHSAVILVEIWKNTYRTKAE
ncbi:Otopetrin [Trinorchestia longiramus]|nr:Otopetrin [Trinorchestia longiramus]